MVGRSVSWWTLPRIDGVPVVWLTLPAGLNGIVVMEKRLIVALFISIVTAANITADKPLDEVRVLFDKSVKTRDTEEKKKLRKRIIELAPESQYAWFSKAWFAHESDRDTALKAYNKAIAIDPKMVVAYGNRGLLKFDMGDRDGAMKDATQAITLDPADAVNFVIRGGMKMDLKDLRGAMEDLNQAVKLDPRDPDAFQTRAAVKSKMNDFDGAIEDLNIVIGLDPKISGAYTDRCFYKGYIKDFKGAVPDCDQATKLEPKDPRPYMIRGLIRLETGPKETACAEFKKAAELGMKEAREMAARECK